MRLRQAHAILEAAEALEAAGIGFDLWPFDQDSEDANPGIPDEIMGLYEFELDDSDSTGCTYELSFKPGLDADTIEVILTFNHYDILLNCKRTVSQPADTDDEPSFRKGVGADLADQVANIVREHKRRYLATHARRTDEK